CFDPHIAGTQREIARAGRAGVKVLVDAVVAWDLDHRAELPGALDDVGAIFLCPSARLAPVATDTYRMLAVYIADGLLVSGYVNVGDVTLGVVIGHLQRGVDTAGAPLLPPVQKHVGGVGNKVLLPYPAVVELAVTAEVVFFTGIAAAKPEIAIENKFAVPKQPHHRRRVGHRDVTGGLIAAAIEVLV